MKHKYIKTGSSLTIVVDGTPYQIDNKHPNFTFLNTELALGTEMSDAFIIESTKPIESIKRIVNSTNTEFGNEDAKLVFEGNILKGYIYGREVSLPTNLTKQIIDVNNANGDISPLFNFFKKCATNQEPRALSELFDFIAACGLAITTEGNFLAYKRIKDDYTDIRTGTMNNSPGTVVSMPRDEVDGNKDRTCSAGLHFAAWEYLDNYASSYNCKTVVLSINPRDVVAIPSDYNNQKGRACRYKIVRDVTADKELAKKPVWDEPEMDLDDNQLGNTESPIEDSISKDWVTNKGSKQSPIVGKANFEIKLSNGTVYSDTNPQKYRWTLHDNGYDIVAYRIIK